MKEISIEGCPVIGTGTFGKVYRLNDEIVVKVMEIDEQKGKISLSRKDALAELEARKQLKQ